MTGVVYMLHFEPGIPVAGNRFARHYIGWTTDVERRFAQHVSGQGSPLVAAAVARGAQVELARTWVGVDRFFERRLKNLHAATHYCPVCSVRPREMAAVA